MVKFIGKEVVNVPSSKTMWTLVKKDGTFTNLYRTREDARLDKWVNEKVAKVKIQLVKE